MRKENYMRILFVGVAALLFADHSVTSATTTCTAPDEVTSSGHCWKDRNLGARLVAESFDHWQAYGDHYQWGRPRDGHQHTWSAKVNTQSPFNDPEHGDFITVSPPLYDWRNPQNDILWQGLGGINNPCPQGFRLPTKTELETERLSWTSNDYDGAFSSPLKLVAAGYRIPTNGAYIQSGVAGRYWSSTVSGDKSWFLSILFESNGTTMGSTGRANGGSVRCLKD